MIKNNFNTLMAERQLKITRVSNDTGISRTTLTALSQEMSKGVQLDTLNTLCNYFSITPCEFFSYIPFDIQYNFEIIDELAESIGQPFGIEYTLQKKALLFINVYDNKGIKKNTFEILYFVLTTYNTTVDVETDEFGEFLRDVIGNSSRIILDQEQFENGDNEFIAFLKEFEVQWQTKIIDDIMQYMAKDIDEKVDGDFVSYLETNFNRYI